MIFALTLCLAAYHAVYGLTVALMRSSACREVFNIGSGLIVASKAMLRLQSAPPGGAGQGWVGTPVRRIRPHPVNDH